MTTQVPTALRTFAFGDLETGVWGVAAAWDTDSLASFADPVDITTTDDESTLSGAGVELRFVPTGGAAQLEPLTAGVDGEMRLCRVEGALRLDGSDHEVACFGAHATIALPAPGDGSARAAVAWLGPDDGFALVALRPRRAKGHDTDTLACALIEEGTGLPVEDPRFSTTYTEAGVPARASLELWVAGAASEEESGDDGPDEPVLYPRRAAGERAGDGVHLRAVGLAARAELFRWHARGREGPGVYVLISAP